jgi:hypothetical protein
MRYQVIKFATPTDIRKHEFGSLEQLLRTYPPVAELASEVEAAAAVRDMYPDAVGMLCPVRLGSGQATTVALVECLIPVKVEDHIPFVVLVLARPESDLDKRAIQKNRHFAMEKWKPPVLMPDGPTARCEVRASNSPLPTRASATFGVVRGKLAIRLQEGELAFSVAIDEDEDLRRWLEHRYAYAPNPNTARDVV